MFEYYPETHTYWLDGKQIPSVTQLVSVYGPDMEADEIEAQIAPATERGTVMHDYLHHRLTGEDADEIVEVPDIYADYIDGVELFLAEHSLEPVALETPMFSDAPLPFAGTPDFVGIFDGTPAILDWKFVSSLVKPKVAAQLGAYGILSYQFLDFDAEALAAVQFLPGSYRLYLSDRETGMNCFNPILDLERIRQKQFLRNTLMIDGDLYEPI